jgi:hypothetical protein
MNTGFGSWLLGMSLGASALGGMLGMASSIFIVLAATTFGSALLYAISGFGFAVLAAPLFLLFLGDEVNRLCSNQRLLRPPNAPIDISNSSARGLAAAHLNHLGFKIDRVYMLEAACEVQCHASRPAGQVKKNSRRR